MTFFSVGFAPEKNFVSFFSSVRSKWVKPTHCCLHELLARSCCFFFSCNRERKRSRMMACQSVLCIVINDLTFFLLFGCRRKFFFSLSNPDTACHFHFFLHTHKHTHTFWACENVYIFMFFMSPLPSQLLLRVLGIHGRKLFSFFFH